MIFTALNVDGVDANNMAFYISCTQGGNDCPRKEECRRYETAKTDVSWSLFKYACTDENDYQLFMEKVITTDLTTQNEGDNSNNSTKNEGDPINENKKAD